MSVYNNDACNRFVDDVSRFAVEGLEIRHFESPRYWGAVHLRFRGPRLCQSKDRGNYQGNSGKSPKRTVWMAWTPGVRLCRPSGPRAKFYNQCRFQLKRGLNTDEFPSESTI
jgi:hypothetical protein